MRFSTRALRPLLERYGDEPQILAWDVINEPEWIKTIDAVDLRTFLGDSVALIHSSTQPPVPPWVLPAYAGEIGTPVSGSISIRCIGTTA